MLSWYQTREDCNLQHNNQAIPAKKKILLSEEQAKLHNTYQEQVVKCEEPKDAEEAGVMAEFHEWKESVGTGKTKEEKKVANSK
jgi:hypothetical protein